MTAEFEINIITRSGPKIPAAGYLEREGFFGMGILVQVLDS